MAVGIDLNSYTNISTCFAVTIYIYDENGFDQFFNFSDNDRPMYVTLSDGTILEHTALGQLLTISETQTELRATPQQISISISGIPYSNSATVLDTMFRGSKIYVWRQFKDSTTGALLGNPVGRFIGRIDSYSILDEMNAESHQGTVTINFTASSYISQLEKKTTGRYTNPVDQKKYYPNDLAFDRVPNLTNANFQFGAEI